MDSFSDMDEGHATTLHVSAPKKKMNFATITMTEKITPARGGGSPTASSNSSRTSSYSSETSSTSYDSSYDSQTYSDESEERSKSPSTPSSSDSDEGPPLKYLGLIIERPEEHQNSSEPDRVERKYNPTRATFIDLCRKCRELVEDNIDRGRSDMKHTKKSLKKKIESIP